MKPSRLTTAAATGLTLALALSSCATVDDQEALDPNEADQEVNGSDETADMDDADTGDEDSMDGDGSTDQNDDADSDDADSDNHGDLDAVEPMGTDDPFADARTAAEHMPMTAEDQAVGLSAALDLDGDPQSDAADLHSQWSALFQEHVYLSGMVAATAYEAGPDSDEFDLAMDALDENMIELAAPLGDVLGEDAEESFLRNSREKVEMLVDYAVAAWDDDEDAMNDAQMDLEEYTEGVGMFFDRNTDGELEASSVSDFFEGHVETVAAAVDSLADGEADAFENLKIAADHVVEGSDMMTEGLSEYGDVTGDQTEEAAELRSTLTTNLNEHVYVAGIAVFAAYTDEDGMDSDAFDAAAAVVDDNAVELADAVGELAGDEQRDAFLELWRDHIDYFVDYAEAVATDDDADAENALMQLDQYRYDAGEFFDEISGGELPADEVADGLGHHVQTLAGAIDSLEMALNDHEEDS